MKTQQAPLVTLDGLSDPVLPAAMNIPRTKTEMLKSGWLDWLESHNRFKFENPDGGKFTAYKSGKGYWTAQRRVHGKLRHEYLGSSSDLTYETLDQMARKMDMGDSAYWREKYPDPRAVHKLNVESHKTNYETVSKTSSQAAAEIEDLKRQVAELELKLSSIEKKLERESSDAQRYYVLWRKYPDLERQFKQKEQKLNDAEKQIFELKAICKRINLDCKVYKLHKHEVVRLEDLTKLGYELQRNLLNCD
jgi:hypothetical protein